MGSVIWLRQKEQDKNQHTDTTNTLDHHFLHEDCTDVSAFCQCPHVAAIGAQVAHMVRRHHRDGLDPHISRQALPVEPAQSGPQSAEASCRRHDRLAAPMREARIGQKLLGATFSAIGQQVGHRTSVGLRR
jgi:hypothetical protein